VVNDQTYYYKVSAINVVGEGPLSEVEDATPTAEGGNDDGDGDGGGNTMLYIIIAIVAIAPGRGRGGVLLPQEEVTPQTFHFPSF
jgi:hypothetical protein